jgi:prepilin-type N-terminal cleavage/methylation domain-containing protein
MNYIIQKGFTLIELLLIISIIGFISSIVLVTTDSAKADARDANRIQNIQNLAKTIEIYYNDNNHCPPEIRGSGNGWGWSFSFDDWASYGGLKSELVPKYIASMPKSVGNESNNYYTYTYAAENAYLQFMWFSGERFCLNQPAGNCYLTVNLEKPKNLPKSSPFSSVPDSSYYMIPIGNYTLTPQPGCTYTM